MKIYISGKISNQPIEHVRTKFKTAQEELEKQNHEVVNPLNNGLSEQNTWEQHMVRDIELLFLCNAIYLLNDWQESKGAQIEHFIAQKTNKVILTQKL